MTVLLMILKILGIILLVIVGLVLLLILLLLFVPLRYQLEGRFREKLKARVDIGWLLKLIHVRAEAINLQIRVKILALGHCFKKMYLGNWGDQKPEEDVREEEIDDHNHKNEAPPEQKTELISQTLPADKPAEEASSEPAEQGEEEKKKEKKGKKEKARQAAQKAREKYESVFEKLEREQEISVREEAENEAPEDEEEASSFPKKLQAYTEKAVEFWDDEKNQKAVALILKELQKIGKHLLPTEFILDGELGLKDPAQTGRIVGWVWRLYPFYGEHIRLDGLYDQERVDVYVKLKGRLRIGFFVGVALRLYMNRQIREWIRYFRHKDKGAEDGAPESDESSGKKAA